MFMRDFDRNGKIDGHDYHMREQGIRKRREILEKNDWPSAPDHSDKEAPGCLTILVMWGILAIVIVLLSEVGVL